jgi:hypothetical protein
VAAPRLIRMTQTEYIRVDSCPGGTTAEQLALIQCQCAADRQPADAGATNVTSVRTQLREQRSRATGSASFEPGFASISSATCHPLPVHKVADNPNVKTS